MKNNGQTACNPTHSKGGEGYGPVARIKIMMKKACPFRGFAECLLENCMAWSGFDCRMFSVSPTFMGGLSNNDMSKPVVESHAANSAKELFTPDELQTAAVMTKQDTQSEIEETNTKEDKQEKENPKAQVIVTEIKVTKNGNTRVVCNVEGGKEDQVIIAKNGVGELLQKGLKKLFEIEYNVMKDGDAWFAVRVKQL